jgi:alpha,alpha-trehalase
MNAILSPPAEVDPNTTHQGTMDPGAFGVAYVELRRIGYEDDGMALACARFNKPYDTIVDGWQQAGGDIVKYWEANLTPVSMELGQQPATDGQNVREYGKTMLQQLVRAPHDDDGPDIGVSFNTPTPGGRFGFHGYYWDTYHVTKGYMAEGQHQSIVDSVNGMEQQINRFGFVPNGNAFFYTDRSQPPYFSHSVRMLSEVFGDQALVRYLPAMQKEYDYWMRGQDTLTGPGTDAHEGVVKLPEGSVLNRYWSTGKGPRLESYLEDFELADVAVKSLGRGKSQVYKDLRAGAASGWDYSSRWLKNGLDLTTINTTQILPIDLNSMLAYSEEALAIAYFAASDVQKADEYSGRYRARIQAINKYLWNPEQGVYKDYNYVIGRQTSVNSAAMVTPLYVGIAGKEQALGVADFVGKHLLTEGGVMASTVVTGQQWDAPNVWAPPNWQASRGFARAANEIIGLSGKQAESLIDLSEKVRSAYLHGIEMVFDKFGIVPEKINGYNPQEHPIDGEYASLRVLGMTVAIRHALESWEPRQASTCLPLGKRFARRSAY